MTRPRATEASLQAASAEYFRLKLPKDFVALHVPNEGRRGGRRGYADGAKQKAAGLVAGACDWFLFGAGRAFGLELKRPGSYLSPAQKAFHARLGAAGVPVAVCRSLDEIEVALRAWSIL